MLNKLRNFTKTKLATVLIGIIIIPFVFWGMGGVFQGGNTNNIAKIKNVNISTEDFFDHIRSLGINEEIISTNIENGILTEILNDLLAKKFIELEIKKLGININDESLLLIIKNNKNFLDENKKTNKILKQQIDLGLKKIKKIDKIIFAYEPVWSIGTGKILTNKELTKQVIIIKKIIKNKFKNQKSKIIYGGSVNNQNINNLKQIKEINGFLIGGASQNSKKFIDIIKKTIN